MAKKKKKMTKAQAASARRDLSSEEMKRAQTRERTQLIKQSAANAQKQASKSRGYMMFIPIVSIILIVVFCLMFTVGPGMLFGGQ